MPPDHIPARPHVRRDHGHGRRYALLVARCAGARWFTPLSPPHRVLARTELAGVAEASAAIVVARLSATHVMVVSRHDALALRAHVELVDVPPDMRRLKSVAEETADGLAAFLRARGSRPASALIRINAERILLETGRRHSWPERLLASARKEVAGRLSVPLATFAASLCFDSDVRRAGVSAVAALCGVVVWLVLTATLEKQGFRYE